MTTGWTPPEAAESRGLASPEPCAAAPAAGNGILVWCPVCGDAPATVEHDGFCSRACRAASLDYHNRREIEFDHDVDRNGGYSVGGYVHDKAHDRKYAKPWRKSGNRA